MNNKRKIILISSVIVVILFAILYISYGYITTTIEGNEISKVAVFNSQIIKVEYSGGTEEVQNAHIVDENGEETTYFVPGSTLTKTFTVKNTGNVLVKYSINLTEISNDFDRPEDLYYEISESGTVLSSGTFPQNDTYIVSKDTLQVDTSKTYTLTIKYLNSEENQIIDQDKVINAKITIDETVKTIAKLNIYGNSKQEKSIFNPDGYVDGYFDDTTNVLTSNSINRVYYMPCEPNTTYNIIREKTNSFNNIGETSEIPSIGVTVSNLVKSGTDKTNVTYTTSSTAQYIVIRYREVVGSTTPYTYAELLESTKIYTDPSPTNPVEVESLGTTKNLFDESLVLSGAYVSTNNLIKTEKGYEANHYPTTYSSSSALVQHLKQVIKPNVTYTLSRYVSGYVANSSGMIVIRNSSGILVQTSYGNGLKSVTFTLTQEQIDSISSVYIYGQSSSPLYYEYIQLEEGDAATEYEPYGKYKVPITISGENLFDISSVSKFYKSSSGDIYTGSTISDEVITNNVGMYGVGLYAPCNITYLKAGTYTLSADIMADKESGNKGYAIGYRDDTKLYYKTGTISEYQTWEKIYYTFSLTDDTPINGFVFQGVGQSGDYLSLKIKFKNIKLELNEEATDYEPYEEPIKEVIYLDQPLRKVGDCDTCADYLDISNQQLIRNVNLEYLSSSTGWSSGQAQNSYGLYRGYYFPSVGMKSGTRVPGYCNVLPTNKESWLNWTKEQMHFGQVNNAIYIITNNPYTSREEVNNYLSNNQMNEPYVVYNLATTADPQTVELPKFEALKGTNNISVCSDNGVCASKIEVEYDE